MGYLRVNGHIICLKMQFVNWKNQKRIYPKIISVYRISSKIEIMHSLTLTGKSKDQRFLKGNQQ